MLKNRLPHILSVYKYLHVLSISCGCSNKVVYIILYAYRKYGTQYLVERI